MKGYQKNSWWRETAIFFMQSFIKLDQLNHKSVIRASYSSPLFYKTLSFFIIISICKYQVGYDKSYGPRNTLNAMYQNIAPITYCIVNKLNHSIKEALYILILRVFKKKSQVIVFWLILIIWMAKILKPIEAVITSTIYDVCYFVPFQHLLIFCYFLAWYIQSLNYHTAVISKFFHF